MNNESPLKRCTKCGIEKPLAEFNKVKHGTLGVRGDCKSCHNKLSIELHRKKHPPKMTRAEIRANPGKGALYWKHRRAFGTLHEQKQREVDSGVKVCGSCHVQKAIADFRIRKQTGFPFSQCRECQRRQKRETWHRAKAAARLLSQPDVG